MKAMLVSVGVGNGVASAIAGSIRTHNPDIVAFLASEKSLDTIGAVDEELNHPASIGAVGELVEIVWSFEDPR